MAAVLRYKMKFCKDCQEETPHKAGEVCMPCLEMSLARDNIRILENYRNDAGITYDDDPLEAA